MIENFLDELQPIVSDRKMPLFMKTGHGYSTRLGVHFSREHPYQVVEPEEIMELLATERFRITTAEEIRNFYACK